MKILHITPATGGYEEVTLLANQINKTNHLAAIEKDGVQYMTGGFLINDTPQIRATLDSIPKENQLIVLLFVYQPTRYRESFHHKLKEHSQIYSKVHLNSIVHYFYPIPHLKKTQQIDQDYFQLTK